MQPINLYFDIRDLFKAPRLALGFKKIWVLLQVNLLGYLIYFIFSNLSFLFNGWTLTEVWLEYGLYPFLLNTDFGTFPLLFWSIGSASWIIALLLGFTAVARITYKQLKGDEFYSSSDAFKFVKKHWHAPIFTHLSIASIAVFFIIMATVFSLIGKIPFLGELFIGIPYLIWFVGSVFVSYTVGVFFVSIFFTHAIVGTMEEDTMGSVFQNYSITWSQPWRTILYIPLIYCLVYISASFFAYFSEISYQLINIIFGHDLLMGSKFGVMISWATNIVLDPISEIILSIAPPFEGFLGSYYLPDTSNLLAPMEYIGASFISVSLFVIAGTVLSYGLSVAVVAQTITILIFRMKTDEDNLLERKDEEELELENEDDWSFDFDSSLNNEDAEKVENLDEK